MRVKQTEVGMNADNRAILARGMVVACIAMVAVVAASNWLVQYPINDFLTWGALTYPVSFLVTDLTNRGFGPARARQVVYVGFALGVALSVWLADWRIAAASGSAFMAGQLLDISIFDRLRRSSWWRAPLASSVLGSIVDTALFSSMPGRMSSISSIGKESSAPNSCTAPSCPAILPVQVSVSGLRSRQNSTYSACLRPGISTATASGSGNPVR